MEVWRCCMFLPITYGDRILCFTISKYAKKLSVVNTEITLCTLFTPLNTLQVPGVDKQKKLPHVSTFNPTTYIFTLKNYTAAETQSWMVKPANATVGSEKWIKQTRQRHPSALIPTCVSACCGIRIGRKNQLVALTAFSVLCAITFIAL